jgi:hypothetical protein
MPSWKQLLRFINPDMLAAALRLPCYPVGHLGVPPSIIQPPDQVRAAALNGRAAGSAERQSRWHVL